MTGKEAYEEDVRRNPAYHDGAARRTWNQLTDMARESWRLNPVPRIHGVSASEDHLCWARMEIIDDAIVRLDRALAGMDVAWDQDALRVSQRAREVLERLRTEAAAERDCKQPA